MLFNPSLAIAYSGPKVVLHEMIWLFYFRCTGNPLLYQQGTFLEAIRYTKCHCGHYGLSEILFQGPDFPPSTHVNPFFLDRNQYLCVL